MLLAPGTGHRERILRHVAAQHGSLRMSGDRLPELADDPWALGATRRVLAGDVIT